MPEGLIERYDERIAGVLSSYDRGVITGTICYAKGMTSFLYTNGIHILDAVDGSHLRPQGANKVSSDTNRWSHP